jgi:hypothetical protein
MEGGGSLFNPGFLGGSFLWWVGQIADDSTWRDNILAGKFESKDSISGWGRRYKVRIIGLHDREEETISSDQLPWAQVMYPITGGGGQTNAGQTPNLRQGNFVFGFFLDGQDMQVPVIMGVLGNNAQTALSTTIGNNNSNFAATSGYARGAESKGPAKEKVPREGLVVVKPKSQEQSKECASPPPGVKLDKFGLRPDIALSKQQLLDAQSARAEADAQGLTNVQRDEFIRQRVAEGIKNRCQQSNSPTSPSQPGATKENVDAVHELSAADVQRQYKYDEKIALMNPHGKIQSSMRAIQTTIDNLIQKISKYFNSITSYIDAVSLSGITDLNSLIRQASCQIAKYMKPIFDKIMEYVLKLLNKELVKVVSALPSSMRFMFADIKEIITELILCLYNKIIEGLCDLIEKLLKSALNVDETEKTIRNSLSDPNKKDINAKVPVCYAETIVGQVIAINRPEIDKANNALLDNVNGFLDNIQTEVAGVSGSFSDVISKIDSINGSLTSALNFENIKLNVFGCELKPIVAVSDFYTFGNGSASQPDSQIPSEKSVENATETSTQAVNTPGTVENEAATSTVERTPFAEPTRATSDVNLDSEVVDYSSFQPQRVESGLPYVGRNVGPLAP